MMMSQARLHLTAELFAAGGSADGPHCAHRLLLPGPQLRCESSQRRPGAGRGAAAFTRWPPGSSGSFAERWVWVTE